MAVTENVFLPIGDPGGPTSGQTQFSFNFPYLEDTDVKVSLDGVVTTAYTFANATTIQFNTAPADGVVVRIYRDTNNDTVQAVFYPGSVIRAQDLNDNFDQILYVTQEVDNNAWDNETDTVKSTNPWVSSDAKVATTAAIDARFQDELGDTLDSNEAWVSSNDYIATTASIDQRIDTAITNDIAGSDGVTITDDGDGTITVGLADNSVDFSKIKNEDIITYSEQEAGSPSWLSDTRLPTTYAAARRFDTIVSPTTPTGSNWVVGKTWLQNDQDLTVSVWNGSNWLAVASGGAFTNQPKVVYVDATAGDDNNDGHRISRPKATIKAAINQINADATYGDGSVVVVAPGVYQEVAPIDITKKDVSIIGAALRSCVIHPTPATETNSLFRVNSGTFLQNLTFTGVKASGVRGGVGSVDPDPSYGLPATQGWNVSFYPGAMIYKSPYIQNCTNFSDSEIDNSNLNAHTPAGGAAGDTDSTVTGGGLLVDGSTVNASSPLRSMVCDSYTHVGLDGPGILVTNNGYAQCTSSYAFFNHYHIKCLNGGQANLAASTTDFGRYGLVVDGRSPNAIFTATTTADADDGDITFTIDAPVAGSPWHGTATRPQSNMLVDIGGNTYPVLSATTNGAGWDVVISRPNPADRAQNLGLDGAVLTGATVEFYLRSMLASSGHTMEYVGSGTNYSALPENGGVPVEDNQVVELNNGKVWTATTDHNGKFKVGDFFTVDQQTNAIFISSGSFNVDLQNLQVNPSGNAVIGANLDLNGSDILDSTGDVGIDDTLDMKSHSIINVLNPTNSNDVANKDYVDNADSALSGLISTNTGNIASLTTNKVSVAGDTMTGNLGFTIGGDKVISQQASTNHQATNVGSLALGIADGGNLAGFFVNNTFNNTHSSQDLTFKTARGGVSLSTERLRIDPDGRILQGITLARGNQFGSNLGAFYQMEGGDHNNSSLSITRAEIAGGTTYGPNLVLASAGGSPGQNVSVSNNGYYGNISFQGNDGTYFRESAVIRSIIDGTVSSTSMPGRLVFETTQEGTNTPQERLRIRHDGNIGISTTGDSSVKCYLQGTFNTTNTVGYGALLAPYYTPISASNLVSGRLIQTNFNYGTNNGTPYTIVDVDAVRISQGYVDPDCTSVGSQRGVTVDSLVKGDNNFGIVISDFAYPTNSTKFAAAYYSDMSLTPGTVINNKYTLFLQGSAPNYIKGNVGIQEGPSPEIRCFVHGTFPEGPNGYAHAVNSRATAANTAGCVAYNAYLGAYASDTPYTVPNVIGSQMALEASQVGTNASISNYYAYSAIGSTAATTNAMFVTWNDLAAGKNQLAFSAGGTAFNNFVGCTGFGAYAGAQSNVQLHLAKVGLSSADWLTYMKGVDSNNPATVQYLMFGVRGDGAITTGIGAQSPYNFTTASAANVVVDSNGYLYRSTSSGRFKTNVEDIELSYSNALLDIKPVWYRSTASADNPDWGYWGFIAEDVAKIDPRLVFWKTTEQVLRDDYVPKTVDKPQPDGTTITEEVAPIASDYVDVPLDEPIAEGVQYDRFVPHLLNLIKLQKQQIEALEARITALETT